MNNLTNNNVNINWPELILCAEANQEWFDNVTITTLKSEYEEIIYTQAWKLVNDPVNVDEKAKDLMNSGTIFVTEHIQIDVTQTDKLKDMINVTVCIDRDEINDEVIEEVLDLLATLEIKPDTRMDIGERKTFTLKQITRHRFDS